MTTQIPLSSVAHPPAVPSGNRIDFVIDHYHEDYPAGRILGTKTHEGVERKGVDVEGVLGVDNGALRIRPLVKPGWGRAGIAYGPFPRRNGLTFGVLVTNGHNTSQAEPPIEGMKSRLRRWVLGSETDRPLTRLRRWAFCRQRKYYWRTLLQWLRTGSRFVRAPRIDENLALGWYSEEVPSSPVSQGSSLIMHALGPECGELWARAGESAQRVLRGLQNVPIYYFVVLREKGAAYYAASLQGVPNLPASPTMRLVAIDPSGSDAQMFAGIHQSVLGQIGFRVDTRVHASQVAVVPEYGKWYGSAHGADTLTGDGALHLSTAETGQAWAVVEGSFERTSQGALGTEDANAAILHSGCPTGFIHVEMKTAGDVQWGAIVWRAVDDDNYWRFEVGSKSCQLSVKKRGVYCRLPATKEHRLAARAANSVQIADDGENIRLYLNGALVYATEFSDTRLANGTGVGFQGPGVNGVVFSSFEAHPREIRMPDGFKLGSPWSREGSQVVVKDEFDGSSADLAASVTREGGRSWSRSVGSGIFRLTGETSVKVEASVEKPNPGRTAYTVAWDHPDFADVEVNITPPGTRKGRDERGRGGLIFWQDAENYITVSLWMNDSYGFSISSFFHLDGYEELYDAVWTNIGNRVHWGVPFDLRVVFDGNHYLASVNREPVLYRALTDVYPDQPQLEIRRVGIVANWEWGNDTGSVFRHFVGRN